jgi:hypothetical protein
MDQLPPLDFPQLCRLAPSFATCLDSKVYSAIYMSTQITKRGNHMDQNNEKVMYDYADKFINLANEMAKSDRSGNVGVAIRFAAARYCAYEASMQTKKLAEEKDKQLQAFVDTFTEMLRINLEDYIKIQSRV